MSKIAIQGIKYDAKSSFQQGPRLAPPLVRDALNDGSSNMTAENLVSIDQPSIVDKGDFEIDEYFEIEKITAKHLESTPKILSLGGDHSITFPVLKAINKAYPKIDILHIDAHADLYDHYEGDPYSHACPFARIMENGLAERLVQVGIRTLNSHQQMQAERFGVEIHQMKDLDLSTLPTFDNPLYISLDIDAFDPAFAPGVSHHEPGGMTTRQVINLLHDLNADIIGADIVEYNPTRDFQNMTAYLAAKMMKEILSKMV